MARVKKYLDKNVYEAAKDRIRAIYDLYDSAVIMFSGGKDSLVILHLFREVAAELGKLPLTVIFEDEEIIPNSVIDFIAGYRECDWLRLDWVAIPLRSNKFVLGKTFDYLQWDISREWVRPRPEWALTLADLGGPPDATYSQKDAPTLLGRRYPGKCAFVTGIRAQESIRRYMACMSKLNDNYLTASPSKKVDLAKPIYDWSELDVFYYLYQNNIPYCPLYDHQLYAGFNLRVATPLHTENAKRFNLWREIDPDFYDRIVSVFPEMRVQDRYWKEYSRHARARLMAEYSDGDDGLRRYVSDHITDPVARRQVNAWLKEAFGYRANRPNSFPQKYLLRLLIAGDFKNHPIPLTHTQSDRYK